MRVRLGIVGGGLISQVEHVPNSLSLPELFELAGVVEPSPAQRSHLQSHFGVRTFETFDELIRQERLDAVLIASPEATHHELATKALAAGLHVLCEKPICYDLEQIDDLILRRDNGGSVFQVAYMKRYDPAVEQFLMLIKGRGASLRFIGVEVNDPDYWPFVKQHALLLGNDIPSHLLQSGRAAKRKAIVHALGNQPDDYEIHGFANPLCASMVHDINLVHAICDALGGLPCDPIAAAYYAEGWGASCLCAIDGEKAVAQIAHVTVPKLSDYLERISVFFDDARYELRFPSPYLNSHQTELIEVTSKGHIREHRTIGSGYQEAFVRELEGFHSAIGSGHPDRNTLEQARRDVAILGEIARLAAENRRSGAMARVKAKHDTPSR